MRFWNSGWILVTAILLPQCKPTQKSSTPAAAESHADGSAQQIGIPVVADVSKLPKCNREYFERIFYVSKDKHLYVCSDDTWSPINSDVQADSVNKANTNALSNNWREVWAKVITSIAYVESEFANSKCKIYESGTAFVVGENLLATNGHVIPPIVVDGFCGTLNLVKSRIWFADALGDSKHPLRSADAMVVATDRTIAHTDDIMLLQAQTANRKPLEIDDQGFADDKISKSGLKLFDDILQLGFSGGTSFVHAATGRVNAIQISQSLNNGRGFLESLVIDGIIAAGKKIVEYDLVSGGGASGGPVIGVHGRIVAINFAGNTKDSDTEFGYGLDATQLIALMKSPRTWTYLAADNQ